MGRLTRQKEQKVEEPQIYGRLNRLRKEPIIEPITPSIKPQEESFDIKKEEPMRFPELQKRLEERGIERPKEFTKLQPLIQRGILQKGLEQPDIPTDYEPSIFLKAIEPIAKSMAPKEWVEVGKLQKEGKISTVPKAAGLSALGLVKLYGRVASNIAKAPIKIGVSAVKSAVNFVFDEGLTEPEKEALKLPLLGKIPTYWKDYSDAKELGMSEKVAATYVASSAIMDLAITLSLGQTWKNITINKPQTTEEFLNTQLTRPSETQIKADALIKKYPSLKPGMRGRVAGIEGQPNKYVYTYETADPATLESVRWVRGITIKDPILAAQTRALPKITIPEPKGMTFTPSNEAVPGLVNWIKTQSPSRIIQKVTPEILKDIKSAIIREAPQIPKTEITKLTNMISKEALKLSKIPIQNYQTYIQQAATALEVAPGLAAVTKALPQELPKKITKPPLVPSLKPTTPVVKPTVKPETKIEPLKQVSAPTGMLVPKVKEVTKKTTLTTAPVAPKTPLETSKVEKGIIASKEVSGVVEKTPIDKNKKIEYTRDTIDKGFIREIKEAKNIDEFIKSQDIEKNIKSIYNKLYGKTTNQFSELEGTTEGKTLEGIRGEGTVGDSKKDIKPAFSGITKFINNNPDGFTISLDGKPVTTGFVVSPYKGRESVLDTIDENDIRDFISKNEDLLFKEVNKLGGWKNEENNKFYLDVSVVTDKFDEAFDIAVKNDQIGFYDVNGGETKLTLDVLKEKIKQIHKELKAPAKVKEVKLKEVKPVKSISKELQSLVEEAKKYKSAEEFINSQGEKMFSGSNEEVKIWNDTKVRGGGTVHRGLNELGSGIYLTDSLEYSKTFGNKITESIVKPKLTLFDVRESALLDNAQKTRIINAFKEQYKKTLISGFTKDITKSLNETDNSIDLFDTLQSEIGTYTTDVLQRAGFDGVVADESRIGVNIVGGKVYNIFDPQNIKTKSQLTDIYNQAVKEVKPKKPISVKEKIVKKKIAKKETIKKKIAEKKVVPKKPSKKLSWEEKVKQQLEKDKVKKELEYKEFEKKKLAEFEKDAEKAIKGFEVGKEDWGNMPDDIKEDIITDTDREAELRSELKLDELFAGLPLNKIGDIPVNIKGTKFKFIDAIGSEVLKWYGIDKGAKQKLVNMLGENDLRKESLVKFFKDTLPVTREQGKLLSLHQENPLKYPIPKELKPYAEQISKLLDVSKKEMESRKLLSGFFPQSFINRTNAQILEHQEIIPTLTKQYAIDKHLAKIKELEEYNEFLKTLRYLPHLYLTKNNIESSAIKLLSEGKITAQFRSALSKLKGRKIDTIDKAKELGLLPEEDIRVILASHFEYVFRKAAIYDTIEALKKNKNIILPEQDAPAEWNKIALSQLNDYRVHPLMARAIEDFSVDPSSGLFMRGYDAINSLGKSLIFYNPIILPFWDMFQAYAAGSMKPWNLLPWKIVPSIKMMAKSIKDVTSKSELYGEAVKGQLYGTPKEGHYGASIDESMRLAINQMDEKYPKWKKMIEKITGEEVNLKTAMIIPSLYKMNWKITWFLDRVLRTNTLRYGLSKGMSMNEAIEYANTFHANYNLFTKRMKKISNRTLLVGTYKANMLFNLPSYIAKKTFGLARNITGGRKPTASEKQSAYSILRLVALFAGLLAYASYKGYKLREGYRLVKKLDKPVVTKEGKLLEERVITLPGPFFEWFKVVGRAKQQGFAGIYMYLAKVPQIAWGLARNRNWRGEKYFDEGAAPDIQKRQIIRHLIADYIAPVDKWDMMTDEETDAMDNIFSLFGLATYKRGSTESRIMYQITDARSKLQSYIKNPTLSNEEIDKAIDAYEKKVQTYIDELDDYSKKFNR